MVVESTSFDKYSFENKGRTNHFMFFQLVSVRPKILNGIGGKVCEVTKM